MTKQLVRLGAAAALLLGGSVPVSAAYGSINDFGGQFCSQNSLQVCMNFDLLRDGSSNDYELVATWVSTQGGGAWTAFGIYNDDPGQPGPNPTVSNVRFVDGSGNTITVPGWTAGGNNDPAINGAGGIWFVAGADTNNGVNYAAGVGTTFRIRFTSTDLASYNPATSVYARAHIQSFGDNNCSIKPDSKDTGDHLVGTVSDVDLACGTVFDGGGTPDATVPEPISMVLLGSGLLGIGGVQLRRRRRQEEKQG